MYGLVYYQIPGSEMALQSVTDKEESLFLSKMLEFERSLKTT